MKPTKPAALFATVAEVAEVLRVSQITIRRKVTAGDIPATQIGSRIRIAWVDIDKYLARQTVARRTDH